MTRVMRAAQTLWEFHCVYDVLCTADVIIGLGSYDLRVATRCADLYHQGYAPKIIFTGQSGHWTHGLFHEAEAEAFAKQARLEGVPSGAILIEPRATNIGENIRLSANLMPDARTVICVTKRQTQLRCWATARKQWPQANVYVTAPKHGIESQPLAHHSRRDLICEMVGDLQRMRLYAELEYQVVVRIPEEVLAAYEHLIRSGFTEHMAQTDQ